jgi:hypothetical protein
MMYSYDMKVRGTMFLWGSSGITVNLAWPLLLVIRNDVVGDPITFGTETTSADSRKTFGALQPGECYTIPLLDVRGVFAICDTDSNITCTIIAPQLLPAAT